MNTTLRVGVVGAGRVGAVLAAALRAAGHEIVAAAGESDASRSRIAALLPGVPVDKPSAVARACDLLLLTVPDDMLAQRGLDARRHRRASTRASTSCTPRAATASPCSADAVAVGARPVALHPAMTFTGTAVDLRAPDRLRLRRHRRRRRARARPRRLVADLGGRPMWVPEERRTLYHAGLAHGANHLVTLVSRGDGDAAPPPAPTTRPARCARC